MITPQIGLYIHIPYCLQKCPYCDFAKYEIHEIPPYSEYTKLLQKEINLRAPFVKNKSIQTLYFGGGTPSLLPPSEINLILTTLKTHFDFSQLQEFTIECNPGTLSQKTIQEFKSLGVNRWSVGAQTFKEDSLSILGRKHSAKDTLNTLDLLCQENMIFSVDLMYALPKQTHKDFISDIDTALLFNPHHVSLYYLTIPEFHNLNIHRPNEDEQILMFDTLDEKLKSHGIFRYEISNFAKPGFESLHNTLYWTDQEYLGFGLSSHSYIKDSSFGTRFWNPRTFSSYKKLVETEIPKKQDSLFSGLEAKNIEILEKHESLTDFLHTSLRRVQGLDISKLEQKFPGVLALVSLQLKALTKEGLLLANNKGYCLSESGLRLSNLVFRKLTYLKEEL